MSNWSRRGFIQAAAAAGIAAASRPILGCSRPRESPSEFRTLHFDLSRGNSGARYSLDVGVDEYPLVPHDTLSRLQARRANGFLGAVPDAQLTHFVAGIRFPADAPQSFTVTREHPDRDGRRIMALGGIHVPAAGVEEARVLKGPEFALRGPTWLRLASNDSALANTTDEDLVNPDKAALWAVYHHPELICLDKTAAAVVANHILGSQALARLAAVIADLGDPQPNPDSKYGGWVEARWAYALDGKTRVFRQDEQGNPALDDQGRVLYEWDWFVHDLVLAAAGRVVSEALRSVRNDLVLVDDGSSSDVKPGRFAILAGTHADAAVEAAANQAGYSWGTDHANEWRWGQRAREVSIGDDRKAHFTVDNEFYRHVGVFAAFEDVDGNIRSLKDLGIPQGALDYEYIQYLGLLPAPERICGIPLHGDHTVTGNWDVPVPAGASGVHLLVGTLAMSDGDYRSEYRGVIVPGLAMTATFELALPAICLAVGVGGAIGAGFKFSLKRSLGPPIIVGVAQAAAEYGLDRQGGGGLYWGVAYKVGSFALRQICGRTFFAALAFAVGAAWTRKAIPVFGIGLALADVASTVAEIGETSSDIARSSCCGRTRVLVRNRLAITVHHDPRDFEWPAVTKAVRVVVACSNSKIFTYDFPFGIQDHQRKVWTRDLEVPTGGKVRVKIILLSDTDWIAGQGFAEVRNVVPTGRSDVPVDITIEENVVPLDATTTYSHRMKIQVDPDGRRRWVATVAAPLASFSCADRAGALCETGVISLNDATGQLAYSFLSAGGGLEICGSPASAGVQGWQFQNVNLRVTALGQDPEETLRQVPCGSPQTAHLLYDLLGAADGPQYAIVPTAGVLTLRQVDLPVGPGLFPDWAAAPCWGRFSSRNLRTSAFHPISRCVIGIVDGKDKLEVLRLAEAPVAAADWNKAPLAEFASGPGILKGNLGGVKAVAPVQNGRGFLALEQDNRRIQALDDQGLPVDYFTARATGDRWWIPLRDETGWVQYLSMSVEPVGFIYVLSSAGAASRVTDFRLDIYDPRGNWMARTVGVAAAQILVDRWRNLYSINQEALVVPGGRTEPSVSQWIPSTPRPPASSLGSEGGR